MRRSSICLWVLSLSACDAGAPPEGEVAALAEDSEGEADPPALAAPVAASPAEAQRVMPGARAAFDKSMQLVAESWVGGPLDEDAIWTAALEGVLARSASRPVQRLHPAKRQKTAGRPVCAPSPCRV